MAYRGKSSKPTPTEESVWPRAIFHEGLGLVLIALAVFVSLTLLSFYPDDPSFNQTGGDTVRNGAGLLGAYLSDLLFQVLGYAAGGFVVLFGVVGLHLFRDASRACWDKVVAILVLMVTSAILSVLLLDQGAGGFLPSGPGGLLGLFGAEFLRRLLGPVGVLVLLLPVMLFALMVLIRFSLFEYWNGMLAYGKRLQEGRAGRESGLPEVIEPKMDPETRLEAKRRREMAAKEQAAAEAERRADMAAKGRSETAMHRQQVETDGTMKREATRIRESENQREEGVPTPITPKPGRWAVLRPVLVGHLRRGLTESVRWSRQGIALVRQWMKRLKLADLLAPKGSKPVEKEAEPDFFPVSGAGQREPTLDSSRRGEEPDIQKQVWSSAIPAVPVAPVPVVPVPVASVPVAPEMVAPVVPVMAAPVVVAPLPAPTPSLVTPAVFSPPKMDEVVKPVPPVPEQRRESIKPPESGWRPTMPVELWPESPKKLSPPSLDGAVSVIPARDLPSEEDISPPDEDRQDLMRGMEKVWERSLVVEVPPVPDLPPFSLMVDPGPKKMGGPTPEDLHLIARTLEQKLADFKIKGQIVDVLPGPVVTTFELDLAPGVRAAKVIGLSDDLARSISVSSVRVVGNVPGKTVIGIEIPNEVRQTVYLKEILTSEGFRKMGSPLAVALGSDIFGNPVSGNLAKMPHLLVAGTTGSGKSVAVNAMICSILFSARPDEVRFLMVDPKMLELSIYEGIPHLLAPVVTDVGKAANLLKWAVSEMENRYRLMSELGVRNLTGFNERIAYCIDHDEQPTRRVKIGTDPETGRMVEKEEPIPLDTKPLIVIVIDELADLMIQVGKEVEPAIARLAQMARAAGLHLILATQRPSVDVITGLIKANFPTRLAFQVSSKIDSRTILDAMGADRLLGMGDGLFLPPGTSHLQRIHAPFVSDKEVHDLVRYLKSTGTPDYDHSVLMQSSGEGDEGEDGGYVGGAGGEEQDELYDQAVRTVLHHRKVSTSMVQRHFKIGYNRAARIVERMETEGLVSAPNGAGKREVLAPEGG